MIKLILSPLFLFLIMAAAVTAVLFYSRRTGRKGEKAALVMLAAGTLFLAVLSMPVTAHYLYLPLQERIELSDAENRTGVDAVVVLMGGEKARILRGIRAFRESGPRLFIISGFSGGSGKAGNEDSWTLLAAGSGVPGDVLRREPVSMNTHEHPLEVLKVPGVTREMKVGVVTSSWHMPRALYEFRRYFPNAFPIPAGYKYEKAGPLLKSLMPHAEALNASTLMIQEYMGSFWYRLRYGKINEG